MTWTVAILLICHRNMLAHHIEAAFGTDWPRRQLRVRGRNTVQEKNQRSKYGLWNTTLSSSFMVYQHMLSLHITCRENWRQMTPPTEKQTNKTPTNQTKKKTLTHPKEKLIFHFISCTTQKNTCVHYLHGIFKSENRLKISAMKPRY